MWEKTKKDHIESDVSMCKCLNPDSDSLQYVFFFFSWGHQTLAFGLDAFIILDCTFCLCYGAHGAYTFQRRKQNLESCLILLWITLLYQTGITITSLKLTFTLNCHIPQFFGLCCRHERMHVKENQVDETKPEVHQSPTVCNGIKVNINVSITSGFFISLHFDTT